MSNFEVHIRVRPLIDKELQEHDCSCITTEKDSLLIKEITGNSLYDEFAENYNFTFDKIFDEETTNEIIYEDIEPLLSSFLEGYNAAFLCYGLTSSGKTYTMTGILEETINYILENSGDSQLTISYLEIYNEELQDLLDDSTNLKIRQNGIEIFVENLSEFYVKSAEDVIELVELGENKRKTAATLYNELSSRSHTVLTFTLTRKVNDGTIISHLKLVDLAGSERLSSTIKETIRETQNINRSLNALSNVIFALSAGKEHIPYRDSELTRYLEDSIGSNCKSLILICLSPSNNKFNETLNSLRFAERAKKIEEKAVICLVESGESILEKLESELTSLRNELGELQKDQEANQQNSKLLSPIPASRNNLKEFNLRNQISNLEFKIQNGGNLTSEDLLHEYQRKQQQVQTLENQSKCVSNFEQVLQRQTETLIHLTQRILEKQSEIEVLERDRSALLKYESSIETSNRLYSLAQMLVQKEAHSEEVEQPRTAAEKEAQLYLQERQIAQLRAQIDVERDFGADMRKYLSSPDLIKRAVAQQLNCQGSQTSALQKYFQEQRALILLIKNKFAVLLVKIMQGDEKAKGVLAQLCRQTIQAMELSQKDYEM